MENINLDLYQPNTPIGDIVLFFHIYVNDK